MLLIHILFLLMFLSSTKDCLAHPFKKKRTDFIPSILKNAEKELKIAHKQNEEIVEYRTKRTARALRVERMKGADGKPEEILAEKATNEDFLKRSKQRFHRLKTHVKSSKQAIARLNKRRQIREVMAASKLSQEALEDRKRIFGPESVSDTNLNIVPWK